MIPIAQANLAAERDSLHEELSCVLELLGALLNAAELGCLDQKMTANMIMRQARQCLKDHKIDYTSL